MSDSLIFRDSDNFIPNIISQKPTDVNLLENTRCRDAVDGRALYISREMAYH